MKQEKRLPPSCPHCKRPLIIIIESRDDRQKFLWDEKERKYVGGKENCDEALRFCPKCGEGITGTNVDLYFLENCEP